MYDTTSEKSFDALSFWVEQIQESIDESEYKFFLIGSKSDLSQQEQVSIK